MSGLHGDIRDRIDAALEKMRCGGMAVRAVYLTEADRAALNRALSREFGMTLHSCGYREHILRTGKTSVVYSTHGVPVSVPKRLSVKVAA